MESGISWNLAGGGEFSYVLAGAAAVIGFTGPGSYYLDAMLAQSSGIFSVAASPETWVGTIALLIAGAAVVPFALMLRRNHRTAGRG
jgi:hypothetical protein